MDILLVGAMARDLLLFCAHGIKAARATEDIDPAGPLRLIGELVAPDPERSRQALSAFLSGFNGNQQPF